jgi:hypothetical protein
MKHVISVVCCTLAFFAVGMAYAKLPPPSEEQKAKAAAANAKAAEAAKKEAKALSRAQDRVVAHYKRGRMPAAPVTRVEKLACLSGSEDRHARIGVELINGKVDYFAFYSKSKPRTCSIEVKRGGPYNRWEDNGATSKVTLVDGKGLFLIDGKSGNYRFVFHSIDRERYCGMNGKINGSLTIIRGKRDCIVEGVMDGHAG